jgi:hypothetical protein
MRPGRIWRGICPLKRGSAADVSVRKGGGGPPDFPRRRRPRCIAPCGGVVWLGRAARYMLAMPSANAGPHALRLQHLNPVGSIGGIANAGSCVSAVGVRDRAGSCATCKPPSDRHRRTGSTRRSFSRDEGRRLAFRKCRRAWPSRRELKTKAACGLLFLARWIRLPRRHMGSRRRVRPDRLRHPRGLRGAAEAQQPREEMGAMLLKHQQDGFGGEG